MKNQEDDRSNLQAKWTDQFNMIADTQSDDILVEVINDFDEEGWEW